MATSMKTIKQIVDVLEDHMMIYDALVLARQLMRDVEGNKSVKVTLIMLVHELESRVQR